MIPFDPRALVQTIVLMAGSIGIGGAVILAAEAAATPNVGQCSQILTVGSDQFAEWQTANGPLEYRPDGIWLDYRGREVGYTDTTDTVCIP